MMAPPKSTSSSFDLSCCRQNGVLKIFKEMKSLHLELPGYHGELDGPSNGASFLRWKAGFGTNLKTCVIVGATSFQKSSEKEEREESMDEAELNDGKLKSRVIWTISFLIAASTRHCLLKRIMADNPNIPLLERVVISDANRQGVFSLGKEELVEMRNSMNLLQQESSLSSMERSPLPELNMKLWYLPVLELPESGYVMKGTTLVFIKPVVDGMIENDDGDPLVGNEKPFSEAVREMIKVKKSYLMTQNGPQKRIRNIENYQDSTGQRVGSTGRVGSTVGSGQQSGRVNGSGRDRSNRSKPVQNRLNRSKPVSSVHSPAAARVGACNVLRGSKNHGKISKNYFKRFRDTYKDRFKFLNGGELDFDSAEYLTDPPPHAPPSTEIEVDTGGLGTAQGIRWCGRCRKRSNDRR
ncbi:RNA-binding KH domain-containing protein [Hibiscus syriacus]|uniref:RNA-binding KH domain-containing protein n=1 Tax=Hibiscus syriacus TaxID=106335 RepID=A0A6A2XG79_HIBSY|nr:RNA-binding KH domain-containing protein [Hibiscus syriacus]